AAAPLQHGDRPATETIAELVEQARLAHAGLAHHTDHLTLAAGDLGEEIGEDAHLALTPDEPAERPLGTLGERRAARGQSEQPMGDDRVGLALHLQWREALAAHGALDE